jgi:glycosyltransferase involved in cell wall biosynthesis
MFTVFGRNLFSRDSIGAKVSAEFNSRDEKKPLYKSRNGPVQISMNANLSLVVVVLTYNEEAHIERLLLCLRRLGTEVFIIDSYSTDNTVAVARALGARVIQHAFVNHAQQFQWALDNIRMDSDWIMRLDADELLEPELVEEIRAKLSTLPSDVVGVNLKRRHIFMGRWIRHGGRYPLTLLRIWRRGQGRIENRWMDEHMVVWGGRTLTFDNDFADHSLNDLSFFIDKHNKYATREAIDRLNEDLSLFAHDDAVSSGASSSQARMKRFVKQRFYNRLSFGVGPLCYFLWRYVAQLGFLDGREGLIYHFLQGFWYRFLVEAKVLELRHAISRLRDPAEIKTELARLTGLAIE